MKYLEPDLAIKVMEAKLLARKNRTMRNFTLLCYLLGAYGAVIVWSLLLPDTPPTLATRFLIATLIGGVIGQIRLSLQAGKEDAKCPVCGYSWRIKEGRSVPLSDHMETWFKCPGCEVLMGDEILDLSIKHKE